MKFQIGHVINSGKTLTEEHKKKIGEANKKRLKEFYQSPEGIALAKRHGEILKGRRLLSEHKQKIKASSSKGCDNHAWTGDKVKYRALHCWVQKYLETPDICEKCGKSGLKGHQIHWANKSGEYHRDKRDWIRLCAKCHCVQDGTINNLNYTRRNKMAKQKAVVD